jgi:prepilin-type processing-associated H-X9-DG protein
LPVYYEGNKQVTTCPVLDSGTIKPIYSGETGGYGYNRELGGTYWVAPNWTQPIFYRKKFEDLESTSATFMFSDSALISTWPSVGAQESYAIAAPVATVAGSPQPTTHFRHGGQLANVAFCDGHVETMTEVWVDGPSWWPAAAHDLRKQLSIGYLSNMNRPYVGR